MKKILLFLSLFSSCSAMLGPLVYAKSSERQLDQIVAVVNDDVVTKTELRRGLAIIKLQLSQENMPAPTDSVLEKQVLDQLINKKLQQQLAKQTGVTTSDQELENTLQSLAKQNQISVNTLYQRINSEGMTTTEYRNELREQLALQKLQQQEVIGRIHITPEEVNSFLKSKVWQHNGSSEYHLEDILIPLSDTPSPEEIIKVKKHAQAVIDKIDHGQSFRQVAQQESAANNALQGGDLGWRKLPEIPSAFTERLVHMQINEVAGPIQTPNGFHVIRLADIRSSISQQSAPDRKQIENLLMQRKFEEAVQNWVSKLRSQAFIVTNPDK